MVTHWPDGTELVDHQFEPAFAQAFLDYAAGCMCLGGNSHKNKAPDRNFPVRITARSSLHRTNPYSYALIFVPQA